MPFSKEVTLEAADELRADYFLQRREMGAINVGEKGTVVLDGVKYELDKYEGLYIGMGTKGISFVSEDKNNPAKFYIDMVS